MDGWIDGSFVSPCGMGGCYVMLCMYVGMCVCVCVCMHVCYVRGKGNLGGGARVVGCGKGKGGREGKGGKGKGREGKGREGKF